MFGAKLLDSLKRIGMDAGWSESLDRPDPNINPDLKGAWYD
jgi:hypothetical protein